jgi:hypothetical protein
VQQHSEHGTGVILILSQTGAGKQSRRSIPMISVVKICGELFL